MTTLLGSARLAFLIGLAVAAAACNGDPGTPAAATPVDGKLAVELKNFVYVPKDLSITSGETVTFSLTSKDIDHTFTVSELGIDWLVKAGAVRSECVMFNKAGTFRIICTIPGHEGAGMTGTIQVH